MYKYINDDLFIKEVVIPYFKGAIRKNFISAIYALDGKIIVATDLYAKCFGYNSWEEVKNKTLDDIYKPQKYQHVIVTAVNKIREKVIDEKRAITYISYFPSPTSINQVIVYYFPILNPSGKVVATRGVGKRVNFFDISNQVLQKMKQSTSIKKNITVKLSKRQSEILFLLAIGFTQEQTAIYLGISRGTIAKMISDEICPLFNIANSNSKLLIEKYVNSAMFNTVPDSLLEPKIVEINDDFELLFNLGGVGVIDEF